MWMVAPDVGEAGCKGCRKACCSSTKRHTMSLVFDEKDASRCGMGEKRPEVLDIAYLCREEKEETNEGEGSRSETSFCSLCLKMFSSKGNLRVHQRIIHAAQRDFECEVCYKRFGTKNNMQRHVDMVHRRERPFECSFCHRKFLTKSCVKRHEHTHKLR
eukprot:Plantae.Rhodophyta-Purpureofilum_apyrenoidigerum.ctg18629.p1 GENE.Plantae.Rhodophyta-Purpureofilum_apyrenoidigerum.ctg18629~~Plantae.Rhodophyta-Purpureofilum_apyrenoidigerum.ctg18629.p1  ORF type:complete len:159 (+),score=12.25 Plantae.Rhodophyta-Purpureofilum_apyrenoidigerum.ctg18629:212-688(+)